MSDASWIRADCTWRRRQGKRQPGACREVRKRAKAFRLSINEAWPQARHGVHLDDSLRENDMSSEKEKPNKEFSRVLEL